jgi:MtN3 and saliva related transmembrane protein
MGVAPAMSTAAMTDLVGYVAAVLTTMSFVPQVWQTYRTRDVNGISLGMYVVFATGVALWLAYGVLVGAWPIVAANGITLALALGILVMKVKWQRAPA